MAAFKVLALCLLLAVVVMAQDGGHGHQEYTHHPKYQYKYGVHDDHTKDIKEASEHRDGHHTENEYKTLEADHKNTRVVKISVDSKPVHHG